MGRGFAPLAQNSRSRLLNLTSKTLPVLKNAAGEVARSDGPSLRRIGSYRPNTYRSTKIRGHTESPSGPCKDGAQEDNGETDLGQKGRLPVM